MPGSVPPSGQFIKTVMNLPAQRTIGLSPFSPLLVPGYVAAIAAFAVAFAVRHLLDPVMPAGFPFLTFFPAVVLIAFVYGALPGALAALLSALACWHVFIPGTWQAKLMPTAFFVAIAVIDIGLIEIMHRALHRVGLLQKRATALADERELIIDELAHRVKNLLANIGSLMSLASRDARDVSTLVERVRTRLVALGNVSSVLQTGMGVRTASLADIIALSTAPVTSSDQLIIDGVSLAPHVTSADGTLLSLIFHEVATNAVKYGALRTANGRVDVRGHRDGELFFVVWHERGVSREAAGAAETTTGNGFGSTLISRLSTSLGGAAEAKVTPDGFLFTLSIDQGRVQ